ncbi:MAG: hypothetical protein VXZ82_03940 [Planctomycetota bacterium]|nr:hypothetical protein [Planctomycetota bacterium]
MKPNFYFKPILIGLLLCCGFPPMTAQAGPLIDWLFGRRQQPAAYLVGQPLPLGSTYAAGYTPYGGYAIPNYNSQPRYTTNYGAHYGSQLPAIGQAGAAYTAQRNSGIAVTTLPNTTSLVPRFRTRSEPAPVTYYRPLLTTDPNTGAQIVVMAPCTSYEYQTRRTPLLGTRPLATQSLIPRITPLPAAQPTYTFPSGGIALATTTPMHAAPPAYGYVIPSAAQAPMPYSPGSNNGVAPSTYIPPATVPGLVAPQAGSTITPAPTYGQITTPPTEATGSTVFPPRDESGDVPPSLPSRDGTQSSLRPELRGIQQAPRDSEAGASSTETSFPKVSVPELTLPSTGPAQNQEPEMSPIPVPSNFDVQRRWNPGLLRAEDMTASRPLPVVHPASIRLAGQSKKIHWASFEEPSNSNTAVQPATSNRRSTKLGLSEPGGLVLPPQAPVAATRQRQPISQPHTSLLPTQGQTRQPAASPRRRGNTEWKSSR